MLLAFALLLLGKLDDEQCVKVRLTLLAPARLTRYLLTQGIALDISWRHITVSQALSVSSASTEAALAMRTRSIFRGYCDDL